MKDRSRHGCDVEILDTTLRDGEQTPGVAFTPPEKLQVARLLLGQMKIDRMEVGSARVSAGERDAVRAIIDWAEGRGCRGAVEILGFIDGGKSADWIADVGGGTINLLAKGSEKHCRVQLRRSPRQHFDDVAREVQYAVGRGLSVNVYLEDWSNGMRDSFAYVHEFMTVLSSLPVERVMLPDTLGVLSPDRLTCYLEWLYAAFPNARLDFHGHNDYGLVTANSLAAVRAGVSGVHATINGLGERTGNQPLAQIVVAINDLTARRSHVVEKLLGRASDLLQTLSGKRCAWNAPVTGGDVFTQTCGVHADGDKKGNLYANALLPERFGRERHYALGKLSGKASIDQNLDMLGVELEPEIRARVLDAVVRLGDKKKQVSSADLPFVIADVLRQPVNGRLRIADYHIETRSGRLPRAVIRVEFDGKEIGESATGDGGYDAFVKALRRILRKLGFSMPRLMDYEVRIPPGGKTDALVEATITWNVGGGRQLTTTGVDSDQVAAAIIATEKMLNSIIK